MNTQQIAKLVDNAYSRLDVLNNIKWTAYRDKCFEMACEEERQHRRGKPDGWIYPKGASIQGAARLFVVKRIAEYMLGDRVPSIGDILHFQPSAIYAAAIVANYPDEIRAAWDGKRNNGLTLNVSELAALDYCVFVGNDQKAKAA